MQGAHRAHPLEAGAYREAQGGVTCHGGPGEGACLGDPEGHLRPADLTACNHLEGPVACRGDRRPCREGEGPCPCLVARAAYRVRLACLGEGACHPACRREGVGPCRGRQGEEACAWHHPGLGGLVLQACLALGLQGHPWAWAWPQSHPEGRRRGRTLVQASAHPPSEGGRAPPCPPHLPYLQAGACLGPHLTLRCAWAPLVVACLLPLALTFSSDPLAHPLAAPSLLALACCH